MLIFVKFNVCGKTKLNITAENAEIKVDAMYKNITIPNLLSNLLPVCKNADDTKTNTKTGAIAFKEPTNKSPNPDIHLNDGNKRANPIPSSIPIKILNTKLVELYFSAIYFMSIYFNLPILFNYIFFCLFCKY